MAANKLQRNDNDYISNKVLTMFLLALIGVFLLMLIYRFLTHGHSFIYGFYLVKGVLAAGILAIAFGTVKYVLEQKNGKNVRRRMITSANIIVIGLVLVFSAVSLLYYDFTISIKMLYILLPTISVLYMIFKSYPREFFSISVICATGAPFLWLLSRALTENGTGRKSIYIIVAGLALMGIELIIVLNASKNKGHIDVFRRRLFLLSQGANLFPVLLSSVIVVLSLALSFAFGAMFAFYCMFAVFVYLFIAAVFYTVKLM